MIQGRQNVGRRAWTTATADGPSRQVHVTDLKEYQYGAGRKSPGEAGIEQGWRLITQRSQVQILPPLLVKEDPGREVGVLLLSVVVRSLRCGLSAVRSASEVVG